MNIFQLFVITTTTVGLLGCANSSTSYSKKQTKAPLELLLGTWNCSIYDDSDPEMTVNATFIKSITEVEIFENGIVKFDVEVEKDTPISFEKRAKSRDSFVLDESNILLTPKSMDSQLLFVTPESERGFAELLLSWVQMRIQKEIADKKINTDKILQLDDQNLILESMDESQNKLREVCTRSKP